MQDDGARVPVGTFPALGLLPMARRLLLSSIALLLPLTASAYGGGVVGFSGKVASQTCTQCHAAGAAAAPTVAFAGPNSLNAGETGTFTFTLTGGPGVKGGMNVAVSGAAAVLTAGAGQGKESSELRHASPQAFSGGMATWSFTVTAPSTAGAITLFGAGNSCNAAGVTGDRSALTTKVITVNVVNQAPTVTIAAGAAATSPTTRALSVGANDDAGEAGLTYTWVATTAPAPVTFSANGSNAAKNTSASFTRAGAYVFAVTLKDAANLTAVSTVSVNVAQALMTVAVAPASVGLATGRTQQFTASGADQFGAAMSPAPTWVWSASGGGTVNAAGGLYTSGPAAGGPFIITAASAGKTGTAQVTVSVGTPPTVATAAAASANPVTGTTVMLSALGADDGAEAALTYAWSVTGPAVAFSVNSTNAAKSTTATFTAPGSYVFTVTLKDASNLTATSTVAVVVSAQLQAVRISPQAVVVAPNGAQQFTLAAENQFGSPMTPAPTAVWGVPAAAGMISAAGLFRAANSAGGPFTLTASAGGKMASATVTVTSGGAPIVMTAATATPATVLGKSTAVRVLGGDEGGEAALVYRWSAAGPGAVAFADNGSNAAKNTTATFARAGSYTLTVVLQDGTGMTTPTTLEVTVAQSLAAITVVPSAITVAGSGTQLFAAEARDQFDDVHATVPAVTWGVSGGGAIDAQGLFTARATLGGPYTVSASSSAIRGTALVTVGDGASDTLAPTVTLQAPGAALSGTATVSVDARDNVAVTQVTWRLDGQPLGVVTAAPFALVLQTRSVANGEHRLEAIAKDAAGNSSSAAVVKISIANAGREDLEGVVGCSSSSGPPTFALLLLFAVLLGRRAKCLPP